MRSVTICVCLGVLVTACTTTNPTMTLAEATLFCKQQVAKPVSTQTSVGISVGSGGKVRPNAGINIGVDLASALNPDKAYRSCVKRNSGQDPIKK